jgi:NADH:ubiquinone oxidoreductase subunit 6 (subunit J)
MKYWEANRLRRKRGFRQLAVGLPLAVVLAVAIFVNFFSGLLWYEKADTELRSQPYQSQGTLILVVIIALLLIVVFVTIFSMRHKWEIHEQRYQELLSRSGGQ